MLSWIFPIYLIVGTVWVSALPIEVTSPDLVTGYEKWMDYFSLTRVYRLYRMYVESKQNGLEVDQFDFERTNYVVNTTASNVTNRTTLNSTSTKSPK